MPNIEAANLPKVLCAAAKVDDEQTHVNVKHNWCGRRVIVVEGQTYTFNDLAKSVNGKGYSFGRFHNVDMLANLKKLDNETKNERSTGIIGLFQRVVRKLENLILSDTAEVLRGHNDNVVAVGLENNLEDVQEFRDLSSGELMNGRATVFDEKGVIYIGHFTEGKLEGVCMTIERNGRTTRMLYAGGKPSVNAQYIEGKMTGQLFTEEGSPFARWGAAMLADGTLFEGEIEDGWLKEGMITYADGKICTGTFDKNGIIEGQGTYRVMLDNKGHIFSEREGNFKDGKLEGLGFEQLQGTTRKGWFRGGLLDGEGSIKEGDKQEIKGTFRSGELKES